MEPKKGKAPAVDDYVVMPPKIIIQLDMSLESPEFPGEGSKKKKHKKKKSMTMMGSTKKNVW